MKPTLALFPKPFRDCSLDELADAVTEAGFDTVDLLVREGYWCRDDDLAESVPRFIKAMDGHGVPITFATANWSARDIVAHPDRLKVFADHGIRAFRMGWFQREEGVHPRQALEQARRDLSEAAACCLKAGVQSVYQLHHGTLIASPSAAHYLTMDLDPKAVGVMLDPGNQTHEGHEHIDYALPLLDERLAVVGVKDVEPPETGMGWTPVGRGRLDWPTYLRKLESIGFAGVLEFMPFYRRPDRGELVDTLRAEVAHIRQCLGRC